MKALLRTVVAATFLTSFAILAPETARATVQPVVIAGSGAAGFRDGRALDAQFLLPSALVYDRLGNLYIADAAAQRIRVLGTDGTVRTLAGSGALDGTGLNVQGGYRDGPALQARFRHPSGLAVAPDGDIYVADTENHAIRLISHGRVSTFAGDPAQMGATDGPIATARFSYPQQVVLDGGTTYVADYGNGLREIAGGIVTTIHTDLVGPRVTGLSLGVGKDGKRTLFVADLAGLTEIDLATGKVFKYRADNAETQGYLYLGPPYALAAFGPADVVYTDLQHDEVKAMRGANLQYITGATSSSAEWGAATDGSAPVPVHGPLGVAIRGDGKVAIAEGGRRRIVLAPAPAGIGTDTGEFSAALYKPDAYRIAFLSNSPAYWSQNDSNSIAHYIEQNLAAAKANGRDGTGVAYFRDTFPGLAVIISRDVLSKGLVDCVVLMVNSTFFSMYTPGTPPASPLGYSVQAADPVESKMYLQHLTADLTALRAKLAAGDVKLLLVAQPFPWDLGPSTDLFATEQLHNTEREAWMQPPYDPGPPLDAAPRLSDYLTVENRLVAALRKTGAPVLDLWPTLRAVEKATPGIIYPTEDLHFSPQGRKVVGDAIARELERLKPWATQPAPPR